MMQSTNVQRQSTGPAPPQATVVYGIPLPPTASDVEVKLVRTVMRLSAFMAIIAVIQQLYLVIVQKFHMQSLLSVLVSLLVPACGWYGAKERNKFFLQTFSCMNWCNALVFGIEFIGELLMFDAEYHQCVECRNEKPDEVNATKTCVIESRLTEDRKIDINNCDQYRDGATAVLVLVLCFGLVLFYSYNGILSSRLSNMDVFVSQRVHPGSNNHVATQQQHIQMVPQNYYANSGVIHTQQQPQVSRVVVVQEGVSVVSGAQPNNVKS
eukprot:g7165.t1